MPSEAAEALKAVVESTVPTLVSAGFKKRRNAFNRPGEPGVVQVISFQLDRVDRRASQASKLPTRRFTVNLGVFLTDDAPEPEGPGWVSEADCQLRQDLDTLLPDGGDANLTLDDADLASWATFHVLTMYGLPWLDERRTTTRVRAETGLMGR
jgi:hypothetical protein